MKQIVFLYFQNQMCFALPETEQERARVKHLSSIEHETKVKQRLPILFYYIVFGYAKFWGKGVGRCSVKWSSFTYVRGSHLHEEPQKHFKT